MNLSDLITLLEVSPPMKGDSLQLWLHRSLLNGDVSPKEYDKAKERFRNEWESGDKLFLTPT